MAWIIFSIQVQGIWVQNSSLEALYFQRYSLYKIGFWNHPELIHWEFSGNSEDIYLIIGFRYKNFSIIFSPES
jgi:hypothetical protein